MVRSSLAVTLLSAAMLTAPGLAMGPARANDSFAIYPSTETLRQVQLAALDCGRENTAATCDRARKLADPLMDHPLLSGFCKDALWAVVQIAVTDTSNSLNRRDGIDAAAGKVVSSCRPVSKPVANKDGSGGPGGPGATGGGAPGGSGGSRPSGFGFGSVGR
ncbi:hypothetical protein VB734_03880 [Synechococcus sp. BA-124 BA4]|uniref:hypothetical protein n=1 Tax=unclassified Synechococcus TaxID=2626047 RepID=UPI002AD25F0D|nr:MULTISPECIES: hypothetical protein [unclassified Synechococcus]MEA5399176.1 hypothetical protein [Synechococcus sp. BA-124 BA4]CAK6701375.1 hypothetical protein BBFGKLBO_03095 [Synechococcus sp. CBW1107]